MGKPTICIGENKDADQLRGNREADQCFCFRYSDSTIPLLLKSEISSFWNFSVLLQTGLCRTCSETTLLVFPRDGSYRGFAVSPKCCHPGTFRPYISSIYISSEFCCMVMVQKKAKTYVLLLDSDNHSNTESFFCHLSFCENWS